MIGTTLAHFRITAKLGEGGMGEVYRAEDTKLGREVAIKVLPEAVAGDPERLARFEREAKVLAALNHPNIAAIYQVEEARLQRPIAGDLTSAGGGREEDRGGPGPQAPRPAEQVVHFLVMELAEGEDLAERLARGPVPVGDAIRLALQIAEALEAAHEAGVVHRDLKPANIKVTPDGSAKVLDFGLAKALDPRDSGATAQALSMSPTLTAQMTQAGVILGTAAYMSPEQAKGLQADKRADIWAFGVVVWEMLTGQRLFSGDSVSDTLAAVLRDDISSDPLPADVPPRLAALLARCLDRNLKTRLRDIGEARVVLASPLEADEAARTAKPVADVGRARRPIGLLAATGLLAAATVVLGWMVWRAPSPTPRLPVTFNVAPPSDSILRSLGQDAAPIAVSPDGSMMVFGVLETAGENRLWLRALDEPEARPLAGTEYGSRPFWSPDGRSIGFFANRELQRVDIAGGPVTTICPAPEARGGTWAPDGTIVFAPSFEGPLYSVAASGGEPRPLTGPESLEGSHRYPFFLPGGRHFLYLALDAAGSLGVQEESLQRVYVGSLDGGEPQVVMQGVSNAEYAAGHLLYLRGDDMLARPFDPERLEFTGEARTVATGVLYDRGFERGIFSARGDMLVFQVGSHSGESELRWFNRDGTRGPSLGGGISQGNPAISPDGRFAAFYLSDGGPFSVWLHDLQRDLRTRFTLTDAQQSQPRFSPDGQRLAYFSDELGHGAIFVKPVTGGGEPEVLMDPGETVNCQGWSPDGRYFLNSDNFYNIFALDLETGETMALLDSEFFETTPAVSPDGRWLAYASNESGRNEVYVSPFPSMSGKQQVSREGGVEPVWNPDGSSIFFRDLFNAVKETEVVPSGGDLGIGRETVLFHVFARVPIAGSTFDVTPDGQRFLVNAIDEEKARLPLRVMVNWLSGLQD